MNDAPGSAGIGCSLPKTDFAPLLHPSERPPVDERLIDQNMEAWRWRANLVYQEMILSVLATAAMCGAAAFAVQVAPMALRGSVSFPGLAEALVSALGYALIFFVAGFAVCAALAMPLYRQMELASRRMRWPFLLLALLVSIAVLSLAGAGPSLSSPWRTVHLAPGIVAALLFTSRLGKIWSEADVPPQSPGVAIPKIH